MNAIRRPVHQTIRATLLCALLVSPAFAAPASSPGIVTLTGTLNDFAGSTSATSGQRHDAVVWVETSDGTFIKTLWKQGPTAFDDEDWVDHFQAWNTARNGSTAFDGFTGATAQTYASPNNPISVTWNCKDASNTLVPDGDYKFVIQYAESKTISGVPEQGPTTTGLSWTKGPISQTLNPPDEGTYGSPTGGFNFTNLSIVWTYGTVPPGFTSTAPKSTGKMGSPYSFQCTADGSDPISFAVTSGKLPTGLTLSADGAITGTPTAAGKFTGKISAINGVPPNAQQSFSITISQAIVFTSATPPALGNLASPYSHSCTVIGTDPVKFSVSSGMLPPGILLSQDGLISGTPTEIGTYKGTITAHNGLAPDATQNFSIVVSTASPGTVTLTTTISDYTGTTSATTPEMHDVVAWVTKADGTFVKTLWKQGPAAFNHKDWTDHFQAWTTARGTSEAFDGFTSATAQNYSDAANNPVTFTWNCQDASGNLVDDGDYVFYVQYSESQSGVQGPMTSGLVWTKGLASETINPPDEGTQGSPLNGFNFTNTSITWTSGAVLAPEIVVQQPLYSTQLDGHTIKDFGSKEINKRGGTKTFTIKNVGTTDLTGLAVLLYGSGANDFTIVSPPGSTTLAPWTSTTFKVAFSPTSIGERNAQMQIVSNDADEAPFDITLSGTGEPPKAPDLTVMQPAGSKLHSGLSKRTYGVVSAKSTGRTLVFTLKNTGTAPLKNLRVTKDGQNMQVFKVAPLQKDTLAPGESTKVRVKFLPDGPKGYCRVTLRVWSNDSTKKPFEVRLSGRAVE